MYVHPYYDSSLKRAFDIVVSLLIISFGWPFLLVIALLILFTEGRPIIFKQQRLGKNKKIFTLYKFRTMYLGAHRDQKKYRLRGLNQAPEPMFKIHEDPRFIGIGHWLSRTGLDEIPQLVNIFLGEMSFIGPRPLPISEAQKLHSSWNFRYRVKPGIFSEVRRNFFTPSLKEWKMADQKTIEQGGLLYEIHLILETLIHLL